MQQLTKILSNMERHAGSHQWLMLSFLFHV